MWLLQQTSNNEAEPEMTYSKKKAAQFWCSVEILQSASGFVISDRCEVRFCHSKVSVCAPQMKTVSDVGGLRLHFSPSACPQHQFKKQVPAFQPFRWGVYYRRGLYVSKGKATEDNYSNKEQGKERFWSWQQAWYSHLLRGSEGWGALHLNKRKNLRNNL